MQEEDDVTSISEASDHEDFSNTFNKAVIF